MRTLPTPSITWRAAALIAALALLAACGGRPQQTRSGFLSDYQSVKRISDIESGHVEQDLLASITSIRIVETRVLVDKTPDGTTIPPDQLALLEGHIRTSLEAALAPDYPLSEQDGPGVGRLRVAVTEVKKPAMLLNIHPASKLTGAGLGGATIESEIIDSQTGRQAAILIESRKGDQFELDALSEFDDAIDAVDAWAQAFRKRLDTARGKHTSSGISAN